MKKLFFLFAFLTPFALLAQKSVVGVTGGITMANQYGTKSGALIKDDQKIGYALGLVMETPIAKSNFSFQPGIFYSQKGRIENVSFKEQRHWSLRYAELQANVLYNHKCSKGGTFFAGGGPTLAADLPSFVETHLLDTDPVSAHQNEFVASGSRSVSFGTLAASDFKGPDWGVNMTIGYRTKAGWSIGYNYVIGLRNIIPVVAGDDATRNHFMGLRISYWVKNK
ncbi:MAG: PorT family protein [Bacteroidetes bacterium]|nr:PorT family protein [Bacteroidota bacterium]